MFEPSKSCHGSLYTTKATKFVIPRRKKIIKVIDRIGHYYFSYKRFINITNFDIFSFSPFFSEVNQILMVVVASEALLSKGSSRG